MTQSYPKSLAITIAKALSDRKALEKSYSTAQDAQEAINAIIEHEISEFMNAPLNSALKGQFMDTETVSLKNAYQSFVKATVFNTNEQQTLLASTQGQDDKTLMNILIPEITYNSKRKAYTLPTREVA